MIIADFGIICLGQTHCSYPDGVEDVSYESYHRTSNSKARYSSDYNFQTADSLIGYWYLVWPKEEFLYQNPFFDMGAKGRPWVVVVQQWAETVRKILEFYIDQSPEKRIAVLIREQDKSKDVVHTALKIGKFMENLIAGNIRWNELYFIEK